MGALDNLLKESKNQTQPTKTSALDNLLTQTKEQPKEQPKSNLDKLVFSVKTLPDFLGGGAYNSVPGEPNKVVNTGHSNYAEVQSEKGKQRDDIVPVGLGGSNASSKNIRLEDLTGGETFTDPLEKQVINDYKSGKISLPEARLKILTAKQRQTDKLDTSVAGNIIPAVKDTAVNAAKSFTGFIKGLISKKPATKPMEFKVGEGLSNTTTVNPGPRISTLDAIKRGEDINVVPVNQPTEIAPKTVAKQTINKSTEIAQKEQAAGYYDNKDAKILTDVALSFPKKVIQAQQFISNAMQPTAEDIAYSQTHGGLTKGGQLLVKNSLSKSGYTYVDPLMGSLEMENVGKNILNQVSENIAKSKNITNITRNLQKIFKGDETFVDRLAEHFVNVEKPEEIKNALNTFQDALSKKPNAAEDFIKEYDKLKKSPKFMPITDSAKEIKVGKFSDEIKQVVDSNTNDVVLTRKSLKHIANKPDAFPEDVVKQIPEIIKNPTEIRKSLTAETGERYLFVKRNGRSLASAVEVDFGKNKNTVVTVFKTDDNYLKDFKPLWKTGASKEAVLPSASARAALAGSGPEFSALKEAQNLKVSDNIKIPKETPKVKTPAEMADLAKRDEELTARETKLMSDKTFEYNDGELENQYQAFKKTVRRVYGSYNNFLGTVEDLGTFKTAAAKKGISGLSIDNLVYSQEQNGDEVLQMFKDRLARKVANKGQKTALNIERTAINKEVRDQERIKATMQKRGLQESYKKMRSAQEAKGISDQQLKRVREKYGATEWKNTSKAQIEDMTKELSKIDEGDSYLTKEQSQILMERDKKLSPNQAIMTEKEAYRKYGFVVPPTTRGGMHAPVLNIEFWKDKTPFSLFRETMERNLENVAGKEAEKVKDFLTRPIKENETMRIQWLDEVRKEVSGVLKKLNIKPRSSDDALVQMYGEGRLVQEEIFNETAKIMRKKFGVFNSRKYQPIIEALLQNQEASKELEKLPLNVQRKINEAVKLIGDKHAELLALGEEGILKQKSPKNWENVIKAVDYFRKKYDSLLEDINTTMAGFDYKPVPKRNDYFRHFRDVKDWDILGVEELRNYLKEDSLPTSIAGETEFFRPGRPFSTVWLKREGNKTSFSAAAGMDNYLNASSRTIFHTDSLQRARALEKYIKETDDMLKINLQNFKTNLSTYANGVSGKKGIVDRAIERNVIGRKAYSIFNWIKQQTSKNMIAANVSSAIMNFIPFTQSLATSGKGNTLRALNKTILSPFKKDFGVIDGVASKFLRRRFAQEDQLAPTVINKISKKAGWLFDMIDKFTAHTVVTAKYYDNIKAGMSQIEAMANADEYAGKLLADRTIGSLPNMMNEKTMGIVTQFQVEINNMYSFIKKDIPRMYQEDAKKVASALIQFSVYSWLANNVYEQLTGRRPTIDPIDYLETIFGVRKEDEDTNFAMRLAKASGNAAANMPFIGGFTGGRFPMGAGIPSLKPLAGDISDYTGGKWKNEALKPITYVFAPLAGGQIKKTAEGLSAYYKGEVRSKTGKTKLFNIDQNAINFWRSALFGKWSSPQAKNYFNNQTEADQQTNKVKPVYDQIQNLIKQNKKDEAQGVLDNLSEEDYKTYKKIKASEKTKSTVQAEMGMVDFVKKIKSLVEQGKKDEATSLINNLSDEEYRIYKLTKKKEGFNY